MRRDLDRVVAAVDLGAVALFAFEGGLLASAAHLDLFGVVVVAIVGSVGGGVLRDVLIGDVPPLSVRHPEFVLMGVVGGIAAFFLHHSMSGNPVPLLVVLDAGGLALFAVSGSAKALDFDLKPFMAVLMGGLTGVGGGVMRDILLQVVPGILRAQVYATAALLGAAIVVLGLRNHRPRTATMIAGGLACFTLRVVAAWQHWNLPIAT